MGDRANVLVKTADEQVCLYTHWGGYELPETLRSALNRGKDRWGDFQYLARIIFCEMVGERNWNETTGFGISQCEHDGGYGGPIVVDVDAQTVTLPYKSPVSIQDYIDSHADWD